MVFPLLFVLHPHLGGWRWAIMSATVEELLAEPTRRCVNAKWCATRDEADERGQDALYSILSFASRLEPQVVTPVSNVSLDHDPIPVAFVPGDAVQVSPQVLQIGA